MIALISYGIPVFDATIDARFQHFYHAEIGHHWSAERRLVENGYAGIDFPFAEIDWPPMAIRRDWTLAALLGYVSTWSALRSVEEAGEGALVDRFAADMAALWGDPDSTRPVEWPIAMRLGRVV